MEHTNVHSTSHSTHYAAITSSNRFVLRRKLSLFKAEQVSVAAIFWTCNREVAGSILDRDIGQSCNGDGASGTLATYTVNLVTTHKAVEYT